MTAVLTDYLADRVRASSPFVIKYIPYGRLSEVRAELHTRNFVLWNVAVPYTGVLQVMPYLSRRAIENKSVLGNGAAAEERRRAAAEIVAKLFG